MPWFASSRYLDPLSTIKFVNSLMNHFFVLPSEHFCASKAPASYCSAQCNREMPDDHFPVYVPPAKTDPDFKAFLDARNPKQQHSSTLESYLIKPIQRVLKYPLLLKELYSLTDPDSEEHYHLDGGLVGPTHVWGRVCEQNLSVCLGFF